MLPQLDSSKALRADGMTPDKTGCRLNPCLNFGMTKPPMCSDLISILRRQRLQICFIAAGKSDIGRRTSSSNVGAASEEAFVLTPKNVQALRTLFNIAHRLDHHLGRSWFVVLENLNNLDKILHSPRTTTQVSSLSCQKCALSSIPNGKQHLQ